ncbi:MAG: Crp/Fnr family transcriptional regulator [Flavobacteriales bacterium]|nr:Crp/Fnr family transcriptional regulator [Flavobacteriales bacterium]MBK6629520.1 Crp/Fnr family transcriptional regulator [Flavobacteriales bacterium]MBK7940559.1 Crp/Fnr family transcriptional regulator [Flavobacteriales bacterium]MBK8950302.1 Crp/Fnr family transcriptional regulator [Flavobacteriales bacterium]MBK9701022.1 Crp/Fnr family transcriptional regulator [Flavobacteriales bacterium]
MSRLFKTAQLQRELDRSAAKRTFTSGSELMRSGDRVSHVPIVVTGTIRVLMKNDNGLERYLYHIFPGETCAMAIHSCQQHVGSIVRAVVDGEAELRMVPAHCMAEWMKYPEWSAYINAAQAHRFGDLLQVVEYAVFKKLDDQLWHYLIQRAKAAGSQELHITQELIAAELGTSREAITRRLLLMQERGIITVGRKCIRVLN